MFEDYATVINNLGIIGGSSYGSATEWSNNG